MSRPNNFSWLTSSSFLSRRLMLRCGISLAGFVGYQGLAVPILAQATDQEAIACLQEGDTQCAVNVFEEAFSERPFDDAVRENLFLSLLVHGNRSLDQGRLNAAKSAVQRAAELIPSDTRLEYLQDATSKFSATVVSLSGSYPYLEADTDELESRMVEIEGVFSEQVNAFALTAKNPGFYNTYDLNKLELNGQGFATRLLVYPTGDSGIVYFTFGRQTDGSLYAFIVSLVYGGQWSLGYFDANSQSWTTIVDFQYVSFVLNQWHTLEVWTQGQVARLFIDRVQVGKESLFDFEEGINSFGVGLDEYASSAVFSSAFMDMAIYEIT